MNKQQIIDSLFLNSNHGTQRPEVVNIWEAAVSYERERIAKWLEVQRNDIAATGLEFATALRSEYGNET